MQVLASSLETYRADVAPVEVFVQLEVTAREAVSRSRSGTSQAVAVALDTTAVKVVGIIIGRTI